MPTTTPPPTPTPSATMTSPTVTPKTALTGIARIQGFKDAHLALTRPDSFAAALWPPVKILSASPTTRLATFSTNFAPPYANHTKIHVHGGAIATLLDSLTGCTLALVATPGFWDGKEVTRNLQMSYFRPVPVGETVVIETEIVSVGMRMATVRGLMKREGDGVLLASCLHDKFYPGGERL